MGVDRFKGGSMESKWAFEDYLDPKAEHRLPIESGLEIHLDTENLYGEPGYALESENAELHVMPNINKTLLYIETGVETPSETDQELLEYAGHVSSCSKEGGDIEAWSSRVFNDLNFETGEAGDYAASD